MSVSLLKAPKPAISLRDDEVYRKAEDRLRQFDARVYELRVQKESLLQGLSDAGVGRDLDRRAAALLESGEVVESREEQNARLRAELGQVCDQLQVAERARDMQRDTVQGERTRVAAAIRERLRPQYRRIVGEIYRAMVALSEALRAEETFRDELNDASIPLADLRPMPINDMRLYVKGYDTNAALWVKDAKAHGLLD